MSEYQPHELGMVAMVKNQHGVWNRAILTLTAGGYAWRPGCADTFYHLNCEIRPLVVIDPEDAEQVEALAAAYANATSRSVDWDKRQKEDQERVVEELAAALKEYANPTPPKPEEPKGLGAVVESFEGSVWVRGHHTNRSPWVRSAFGDHREWDAIPTPLTVLHPGYTPEAQS